MPFKIVSLHSNRRPRDLHWIAHPCLSLGVVIKFQCPPRQLTPSTSIVDQQTKYTKTLPGSSQQRFPVGG